jgi:AraC-like DNA-binding protein
MLVSTDGVASRNRLEFWGEVVCRNFCEVDFDRSEGGGDFHGAIDLLECGSIRMGHIRASAQQVLRTRSNIAQSSRALFFLCLQVRGRGGHRQAGRVAHLQPGDFALVDTTRPYDLIFTDAFSQLVMCLPHEWVTSRIPDATRLTACAVTGRTGTGRVASTFMRQLALQLHSVGSASLPAFETTLIELLAAALGEQRGHAWCTSERQSVLIQRVLQYIETHLGDPDLSCARVAEQHRISERHLRNLFKELTTTPSEWIWQRRLERAREDLGTAPGYGHSVTSVCFRWGFKDTAHFSHAFKARFGCTPSETRKSAAQNQSTPTLLT